MPLITVAQIKQFLQLASTEHDALLADIAIRASAVAEMHCDRVFSVGTYSPSTTPDDALLDGKGLPFIYTPQWPIVSVSELKLVQDGNTGDVQTYPAGGYAVNRRDGKITLVRSAAGGKLARDTAPPTFPRGTQNVAITYVAGFAELPADLVEAVILIAAHMFGLADQRRLMAQSIAVAGGGAGGTTTFRIADMPLEARVRLDRHLSVVPR